MVLMQSVILTLIISLGLFILGIFLKGKGIYLSLSGAVILLIFGISLFGNPIQYKTGEITLDDNNSTKHTTTYTYTEQDSMINNVFSWVFLLLGLLGILTSSILIYNQKYDKYDEVEIN
jgi:hypothetical protein